MPRTSLTVTRVSPERDGELEPLWTDLLRAKDDDRAGIDRARAWWTAAGSDHASMSVAWTGDRPVGFALAYVVDAGPAEGRSVIVSLLHVLREERRRGVGRSLVADVLSVADALGIDQVGVDVDPSSREVNRFFAKLGFGPLVTRRLATVPTVRRLLAPDPADNRLSRIRTRTIARRRAARESGA